MTDSKVFNVLFVCRTNSIRSIMAEALINELGKGKFRGFSAGREPKGSIPEDVIGVLDLAKIPSGNLSSKSYESFLASGAQPMDFVFNIDESTQREFQQNPIHWPGDPMTAYWPITDPASFDGTQVEAVTVYQRAFRELRNRIQAFVELPISALDKLRLQRQIDDIGVH